ncbi:hypothetical protein ABEW34_17160 [Paenibacillus algorifonticola]|uniref:hypothetical protein n=1 Tax=Paenibacillus algorifonticola TaxID=684063 RepID=UPI003D2AF0D7
MKEAFEKRCAFSKHYDQGDGTFRAEYYSAPIHYRDINNTWREICTDIVPIHKWEFKDGVTNNSFNVYFGDTTSQNLHLFGLESSTEAYERWINFKLKDASPERVQTLTSTHKFMSCFDGVDIEYIVSNNSVKENIILNKETNLREFIFTIKKRNTEIVQIDDDFTIIDAFSKEVLWEIDDPYMIDSVGNISCGIKYALNHDGEYETLTVQVEDEEFLKKAIYPVSIDPTVISNITNSLIKYDMGYPVSTASSFVGQASAVEIAMRNSTSSPNLAINRGILDIDLPLGIIPVNIGLALYVTTNSNSNFTGQVNVYRVTSSWSSKLDVHPTVVSLGKQVAARSGAVGTWYNIDITKAYRDISEPFGVAWELVADKGFNGGSHSTSFASTRNSNAAIRPKITMVYIEKPLLVFHNGNINEDGYYNGNGEEIFKLLDFGTLVAGQVSETKRVYLKNLSGFKVIQLRAFIRPVEFPDNLKIEISRYNSPFIPEETLIFNGTFEDGDEVPFYVRIITQEETLTGGDFNIYAKAGPL